MYGNGKHNEWLAGSKRKRLVGTVLIGLGVLLEVIQGYIRFPLGLRAKTVALLLMSLGLIFLSWGAVDFYFDYGTHEEKR